MRRASVPLSALLLAASVAIFARPTLSNTTGLALARAVEGQVGRTLLYDPAYTRLAYPGGDVPIERGVCSDVVVRALRTIGVDLQVEVHQDMGREFRAYPQNWGLRRPDRNIDHRRVPNLMTYFRRQGKALPLDAAYEPGDIVAWRLPNGLHHIGIVSSKPAPRQRHKLVVHNIGRGAELEDVLHSFQKLGHYRW